MPSSAIKNAKDMMFVDTALGNYLTRLGGNYGVPRPAADPSDDNLYRQFIQLLAAQPKCIHRIVQQMMEILFGTAASLVAANRRPWRIFEIFPNVLTVEVPTDLIPSQPPQNQTYLHGLGGRDGNTDPAPSNFFYVQRAEDFTVAASPMAGLTLRLFYPGAPIGGAPFTIVSLTFNKATNTNTFQLLTQPPANLFSVPFHVEIPSSRSFPGNYFLRNATHHESEVNNQPVVLFGPGLVDIFDQYMLQLVKAAGVVLDVHLVAPGYVHPQPGPPTLRSIAVTPVNPTISHLATQQFVATGTYSDGSMAVITNSVLWFSSDTTKATINATGLATGVAAGQTVISCALSGVEGSTTLTLT